MPLFRGTAVEVALNDQSHPTAPFAPPDRRDSRQGFSRGRRQPKGRQLKASVWESFFVEGPELEQLVETEIGYGPIVHASLVPVDKVVALLAKFFRAAHR